MYLVFLKWSLFAAVAGVFLGVVAAAVATGWYVSAILEISTRHSALAGVIAGFGVFGVGFGLLVLVVKVCEAVELLRRQGS